jgi:hypothetical protein
MSNDPTVEICISARKPRTTRLVVIIAPQPISQRRLMAGGSGLISELFVQRTPKASSILKASCPDSETLPIRLNGINPGNPASIIECNEAIDWPAKIAKAMRLSSPYWANTTRVREKKIREPKSEALRNGSIPKIEEITTLRIKNERGAMISWFVVLLSLEGRSFA